MNEQELNTETIFTLRLPGDLRELLDTEAKSEERSRHGQILKILRDWYKQQGQQEQRQQAA